MKTSCSRTPCMKKTSRTSLRSMKREKSCTRAKTWRRLWRRRTTWMTWWINLSKIVKKMRSIIKRGSRSTCLNSSSTQCSWARGGAAMGPPVEKMKVRRRKVMGSLSSYEAQRVTHPSNKNPSRLRFLLTFQIWETNPSSRIMRRTT